MKNIIWILSVIFLFNGFALAGNRKSFDCKYDDGSSLGVLVIDGYESSIKTPDQKPVRCSYIPGFEKLETITLSCLDDTVIRELNIRGDMAQLKNLTPHFLTLNLKTLKGQLALYLSTINSFGASHSISCTSIK